MPQKMSRGEFVALIAMMFATIAFSTDAMLPALPQIGLELSPDDTNRAGLVLTSFVFGLGLGTFVTGPLSDAFGRKPVILWGAMLYIVGAAAAWAAQSIEMLLLGRALQGLGAAAPRIVGIAVVRDLYAGREMARIMSIAMVIFTIFPAFAPLLGAGIIAFAGWRGVFLAFVVFALIVAAWTSLRLPETLAVENRRPFKLPLLWAAMLEMMRHPIVRLTTLVQSLCLGALFALLTLVQPIFDIIFDKADSFPFWFGAIALAAGGSGVLNAKLVVSLGMRRIVAWTMTIQTVISLVMLVVGWMPPVDTVFFPMFVFWQFTLFFMAGMTMGNLNAMAMEPMGHIAGMAASITGGLSTVAGAILASIVGLSFNGTLVPLALAATLMCGTAALVMLLMTRIENRQLATN